MSGGAASQAQRLGARGEVVSRLHVLTVDVEEYFHPNAMDEVVHPSQWDRLPTRVESSTRRVLDLLAEHGTVATFFVLGWVAERFPALVREIVGAGHELACHGHNHRLAYKLGATAFRADVERAKRALEDASGVAVEGFRAASFSIVPSTPWAIDTLIDLGFRWDASIFPIRHDIYGFPGFARHPVRLSTSQGSLVEVPATTVEWCGRAWPVAGGGYLRILPLIVTRRALRRLDRRESRSAIVYIHPWELDPEQPRLATPVLAGFRQYANLGRTEDRLRRLLREFRFGRLTDVLDLESAPGYRPAWRTEAGGLG